VKAEGFGYSAEYDFNTFQITETSPSGSMNPKPTPSRRPEGIGDSESNTGKPLRPPAAEGETFRASSFTDIDGHWAARSIEDMYGKYMVKGVSETRFAPEDAITRAEFTLLAARALNLYGAEYRGGFKDVSADDWYAEGLQAAYDAGLLHPALTRGGAFEPDRPVSREEMASIIARTLKAAGADVSAAGDLSDYADEGLISDWALEDVAIAAGAGVIRGMNGAALEPGALSTRAQAALLIDRLMKLLEV
jgi:hypothetical protein